MTTQKEEKVLSYFEQKAQDYDKVDKQTYWRFSDNLLWYHLKQEIRKRNQGNLLDAGGGTGRWSFKIQKEYPELDIYLSDFSEHMLEQARKKNKEDITIKKENLKNTSYKSNKFDIIVNLHNVLGFSDDTEKVLEEFKRIIKPEGQLISFIPNKYHGVYFNIRQGNYEMAKKIATEKKGKYVDQMPVIDFFDEEKITKQMNNNGLSVTEILGFPVSIYPGYKETQIEGETKDKAEVLTQNFQEVLSLEKQLIGEENHTRGNNLFVKSRSL